jgi:hypothetical protein
MFKQGIGRDDFSQKVISGVTSVIQEAGGGDAASLERVSGAMNGHQGKDAAG